MSIAKQTKKHKKPNISSPTRAMMKKRREIIESNTPREHKREKAGEDIRKHNLD